VVLYVLIISAFIPSDYHQVCVGYTGGVWDAITRSSHCAPWISWGFGNALFHFLWVGALLICQSYQVGFTLLGRGFFVFSTLMRREKNVCQVMFVFLANEQELTPSNPNDLKIFKIVQIFGQMQTNGNMLH